MSNLHNFLDINERTSLKLLHRREKDRRLADRIKTIIALDAGWSYQKISEVLLLDDQTIKQYKKLYDDCGVDGLCSS